MHLRSGDFQVLYGHAIEAATAAGKFIQSQIGSNYQQRKKDSKLSLASQVVTEIDIQAEHLILELLQPSIATYDLGLLAEESENDNSRFEKDYFWCIDPMDGTLAFTEGRTGYAVSIALVSREGDPLIGVVYVPDTNECYASLKENGVYLNGSPFSPANENETRTLQVFFDHSFSRESYKDALLLELRRWSEEQLGLEFTFTIGFGAVRNALAAVNAPAGLYFKFPKKEAGGGSIWDFAATRLLAEELGHHVSDTAGRRLHLNGTDSTFMNRVGVIFTTVPAAVPFMSQLRRKLGLSN